MWELFDTWCESNNVDDSSLICYSNFGDRDPNSQANINKASIPDYFHIHIYSDLELPTPSMASIIN